MDNLFPYGIVMEAGFYGLKDANGNFAVPCIMDEIVNLEDEEFVLSFWYDYGTPLYYKESPISFYTKSGRHTTSESDYAVSSSDQDIYVCKQDQFVILSYADYEFQEIVAVYFLHTESVSYAVTTCQATWGRK